MTKEPADRYSVRIKNVRRSMRGKRLHGLLITDLHNVRYLTGFSGSSGFLFLTEKENFFVTDFRYREQSEREIMGADIIIERGDRIKRIEKLAARTRVKELGFESSVSYDFFKRISNIGIGLNPVRGLVEKSRETKDLVEIALIREAVRRSESAFIEVKPYIKKGARERAIALRLEERLKKKGCRDIPFDIIVASGPNSAMPHASPTERSFEKGDLVIIDWGGEAHGYYSDMTRTLLIAGEAGLSRKREIYRTVLEANRKAIARVKPGVRSKELDEAAREVIRKAGYGKCFGHGTGHGVGIQVHEAPRVSWSKSTRIRANMVFTVEPGIYLPDIGGVRIEDMVLVEEEGHQVLTSLTKSLEIV